MKYQEIIKLLSDNILLKFNEIYHSAEIVTITNNGKFVEKFPAVNVDDEWLSLVPTDQKETIYIRRNGDDTVMEDMKIGGCIKSYKMSSPLRVVYFKDHAENHCEIITNLMRSVLVQGTKLKSVIRDKWRLQKEESSGDYNFGATTAYFAIDIYALWNLMPNTCDVEDFCFEMENPLYNVES